MSAGPRYEYHWKDAINIKAHSNVLLQNTSTIWRLEFRIKRDHETPFPSKIDVPFPQNLLSVVKIILKHLFKVYAHISYQHFDPVM